MNNLKIKGEMDLNFHEFDDVRETKTGLWEKKLGEYEDGSFMVEVAFTAYIGEYGFEHTYVKEFETEKEAYQFFNKISTIQWVSKNMEKVEW